MCFQRRRDRPLLLQFHLLFSQIIIIVLSLSRFWLLFVSETKSSVLIPTMAMVRTNVKKNSTSWSLTWNYDSYCNKTPFLPLQYLTNQEWLLLPLPKIQIWWTNLFLRFFFGWWCVGKQRKTTAKIWGMGRD